MRFGYLLMAAATVLIAESSAQEGVGRAFVDGKVVILYGDGTWDFESTEANCSTVSKGIRFCGDAGGWKKTSNTTEDAAAMFRFDDRNYGLIIDEMLGIDDGMDKAFMTDAIISNAAAGTGVSASDIVTVDIQDKELFGREARTITYLASFDGLDIVYYNSMLLSSNRTIQLVTYAVSSDVKEQQMEMHEDFISKLTVD